MERSLFEKLTWRNLAVSLLSPLFMTLFFLQGMRTYASGLYVTIWNIGAIALWDIVCFPGLPMYPLLTILVFAFPLFALVVAKKVTPKRLAVASAICLSICAFLLGFSLSYELEMLLSSLVVGFYSIFFPFYLAYKFGEAPAERSKIDLVLFTCGLALALSFDLVVRTLSVTYDAGINSALLPLQFVFALTGVILGVLMQQESLPRENVGFEAPLASRIGGTLIPSGVGALFFLEFAIFASPNSILRWTQPNYTIGDLAVFTSMLVLVTLLPAMLLAFLRFRPMFERWQTVLVGNLIIFAGVVCLPFVGTWLSAVILLIAQFFIIFSLYAMLRYVFFHRFKWTKKSILASSFFVGLLILLWWDFMYAFSFAYAFIGFIGTIFKGQLPIILLSITGILCVASTLAALKTGVEKRKMRLSRDSRFPALLTLLLIPLVVSPIWCGIFYKVEPQPSLGPTLKIMTYNIHEGYGVDGRLDLERIAATIRQWNPDILVLQEVDQGVVMTAGVDEARWLGLNLNMYYVYAPTVEQMWQGDVILSKYPILDWNFTLLPSPGEVDVLLKATLDVNGQNLTVFGVHFTFTTAGNRQAQMSTALDVIRATSGPIIWAGDFNVDAYTADPTDKANLDAIQAELNDSFDLCPSGSLSGDHTSPSWDPYERIDYVFVSTGITVVQHGTIESQASDHLPVFAEIQLPTS